VIEEIIRTFEIV